MYHSVCEQHRQDFYEKTGQMAICTSTAAGLNWLALWRGEAVRGGDHRALLGIGEEAHDVELRVRRGVEEDPAGYDWTSMGRIRVPADRADLVGCLPQRRFGPPWRPPWLTLVTAYSRRREQAFYNFTSPILQFRID